MRTVMMKTTSCFALLATLGLSTAVVASSVAPSVTGTVTRVIPVGNEKQVTINGHTYTVTTNTKSYGTTAQLQPGQPVTLLLAGDGHTVMMTNAAGTTITSHP